MFNYHLPKLQDINIYNKEYVIILLFQERKLFQSKQVYALLG